MKTVTIQINDLFEFEGQPIPAQRPDHATIEAMVRRQFEFLRQPLTIEVAENVVTVSFTEESITAQDEAVRLAKRASQRAGEGNYEKAIGIFKRVLELMPSLHLARRDLAMSYVEAGDVENAVNHLIEVLRLNPQDVWSWVVLANLYIREKKDKETGEKFIRRALAIAPDDAWALNSLATLTYERGQTEEAVSLFEKAIAANPDFANSYYGEAVIYSKTGQPEKAGAALARMFHRAKVQDIRSQAVFQAARQLFAKIQGELAERNESEAFKAVENFRASVESLSGFPVRVTEGEFKDKTSATVQMAWKHGRDELSGSCRFHRRGAYC